MRQRRNLTVEGKITSFKTLTLSIFVFLAHVLPIPNEMTTTIQRIQKEFLWNSSNAKIKHVTIDNDFQYGGLKNVNISATIHRIFEIKSSFLVKQRTRGKVQFPFFSSFWEEDWVLGYHSMKF